MHSKNKRPMTASERRHVEAVKSMPCAVCSTPGPSEAHEMEQGLWFAAIPLCPDCHRCARNGLHWQRFMWKLMKKTELTCLNETLEKLMGGKR